MNRGVLAALSFAYHRPEKVGIIEGTQYFIQIRTAYDFVAQTIENQGHEINVMNDAVAIERIMPR
jgi:hypothetical protein